MEQRADSSVMSSGAKALHADAPAFVPPSSLKATATEYTPPFRKEIFGAVVEFGPGGTVVSINLPTDSSIIQIIGLKPNQANVFGVIGLLAGAFGLSPDEFSVEFHEVPKVNGLIATVNFNDSKTAQTIVSQAKQALTHSNLIIKEVVPLSKPSEWIQLGTVKISWEKAGRMAFIEYKANAVDININFPREVSRLLTPSGRRIKCNPVQESKYDSSRGLQSFSLNNLDIDADSDWLKNLLVNAGYPAPKKIKIREVHRDGQVDDDECIRVVEATLKSIGPLESFYAGDSVDGARRLVTATFCSREDAVKAVKTFRSKIDRPTGFDSKKLTIEPVVSMKVNIPIKIAIALDTRLEALRVELQKDKKDMLKVIKDTGKSHWVIRFSEAGDGALAAVAKTKARIEKMLAGTVVSDSGVALWHRWFATADDAGKYLNWLSLHTNVLVQRSIGHGHLILYGGTYNDRRRAWSILKAKIEDLNYRSALTVRPIGGMSIAEALTILKPVFGDKIRLITTDGPPKIKLCGSAADIRKARLLLDPGTKPTGKNCVICWYPPSSSNDTITTPCGHVYCRECLSDQLEQKDVHSIPLTCAGVYSDDTECKYIFEIKFLREVLSAEKFDTVLNLCLDLYIRSHSEEFTYCPTISCPTIYRPIPKSQRAAIQDTTVTCTTCLQNICTSCRALHSGLTCRQYFDAIDGQDALEAFKIAHNTKDCPSCGVPIEKEEETCNHMLCAGCGTHFCWVCLYISEDMHGAYEHLETVHGGNGLENVPLDQIPDVDGDGGGEDRDIGPVDVARILRLLDLAREPRNMVHGFPARAPAVVPPPVLGEIGDFEGAEDGW